MFTIDGSMGEGGGQVLRSSLALSAICQRPYTLSNIRAKRSNPGLQAQHLCSVRAAARVSNAAVEGDALRSRELSFYPQDIVGGYHEFHIGTAGSCSLVLQTILPMFLYAKSVAEIRIHGGTHNPWSPSIDFMQHSFLPLLRRMGAEISLEVETPGFYPRGGGCIHVQIDARNFGTPIQLLERGKKPAVHSLITSVNLPMHIGEREEDRIRTKLGIKKKQQKHVYTTEALCEGNFVSIIVDSEYISECFGEPAKRGVPADRIADKVCKQVKKYLKHTAPVGEYLADQLLLPMLLAGGGEFIATKASLHATTNAETIALFCGERVSVDECEEHDEGSKFHIAAL
ncbi:MAG: RNA 3'-terminal phosphate cyclase [Planctomycetes bacterium]|nr:RNA 3'-terminal phosphate cyclase [Planctomycetota bacterium]